MAFDPAPSSLFPSWSEDGTTISVPIASIANLTAAEADGTTGDWRAVIGRILDDVFNYYDGLAATDQPAKLTFQRTRYESGASMVYKYTILWSTDIDEISTTAE
jgi:hypothetical protein